MILLRHVAVFQNSDVQVAAIVPGTISGGKIESFSPRRNNACGGPRGRGFELLWNWPGPSLMCVLWHRLEIVIAHILYRCELEIVFHCLIADVVIHITLHIL